MGANRYGICERRTVGGDLRLYARSDRGVIGTFFACHCEDSQRHAGEADNDSPSNVVFHDSSPQSFPK
jgi:hypothetical protein